MKKIFLVFAIFFAVVTVSASELFYSNGSSISIAKAESYSVIKSAHSAVFAPKNELYRLNTGSSVYSFVSGNGGELPVYFLGDMPVVAERMLFWRGEKAVEYIEKKYGLRLVEIMPSYPLYVFAVKGDSVETAEKIVKEGDGYAFPDLVRETTLRMVPASAPKDPYFDVQWHLQNTGTVKDYQGKDVSIMKNADTKFIQMLEFSRCKHNHDKGKNIGIAEREPVGMRAAVHQQGKGRDVEADQVDCQNDCRGFLKL